MSSKRRTLKQSWHSNISPQKKKMMTTTTMRKATSTTMEKTMMLLLTTSLLFLVDLHIQPTSAENASDRDDVNNPHAFTFTVAGSSFVSFHPVYSNKQHQRLGLNFRTFQSDSMLLYHTTDNVDPQLHPLLKIYELRAELRQGRLHVHYRLNEFLDNFVIGQNLNDNEWHKLELNMDINTGGFAVSLDSYTSQQGELKAFEPLIRQNALQWEHLPSSIYYGGTDRPQSSEFISFIGCLKDLMYENSDGDYIHVPIETSQNVTEGCHHQCDEEENPCQHNSTCINHYDHVTCECFGTDYEGEFCEKEGVTKITLRGYEWLTYQLYTDKLDPAIQIARVSMEFKTERNTGILLYAVGGSPTYSHIIALLNSGFVNVSISSDNVDYDFSISVEMEKDRWHNLTLVHQGPVMYVHLDDKTVQKTVQNYLNLDPHVYFGGGKNFVKTKGLEVTQNFIGCLRNIYFNDKSILYDLRYGKGSTQYHGGTAVSYGCNSIRNIPLSFPRVGTMLTLENPVKDDLDIQLEFRTIKDTAVLLYATLSTFNSIEGHDIGTLQVLLSDGYPELVFVPLRKKQNITQTITFDNHVNDNLWHSLNLTFRNRVPSLTIDGVTLNAVPYDYQKVELKRNIIIGYDFSVKMGFMGCIRNVYLQDKEVDLITIVQSAAANGPQLDGCPLEDFCHKRMICEHNSKCVSDWRDMHCDCTGTGYEGETCHFAKHRQNCNDYYLAGMRKSGVYPADLDGNGPLPPTYITCDMQSKKMVSDHEAVHGVTIVTHNLDNNYTVQSQKLPDLKITISYREMSKKHLALLSSQSAFCEQKIEYQCYDMPIRLGSSIWFKTAKEVIVKAMGTDTIGACSCSLDYSCSNNYNKCNCDQRQGIWQKDSGVIKDKEQVPITDIYAERHESIPHGIGTVSLGPLKCWGDRVHQQVKGITFKSRESYLQSPAWTYEDLHFSFRTFNERALLVYQTDGNGSHIVIKLESGNTIKFEALLGKNLTEITLQSDTRVDDGQWHIVKLEHDNYNIRMTFGMKRELRKFTSKLLGMFPSDVYMYIGGAPSDFKHVAALPGLAGCIRDLVYNNQIVKLDLPGIQRVGEVYPGCTAACEREPCQNGGRCVELWGSYDCICVNKWSHLGFDCDQNIDKDTVSFTGQENSFLFFDKTQQPSVMDETIVVSFRTRKMDALLLYLHDNFNNFVQLELQEEKKIILTFNSFSYVRAGVLEYPEILNDENWHQIIVEKVNETYRIQIGQSSVMVFHLRIKKHMEPFEKKVSVMPPSPNPSKKFVHLYVGGVPFPDTQVPNLAGCIRGLKIGSDVFYLRKSSRNKASVKKECKAGCGINPCLNDGHCTNLWGNKEIFCDCSMSSFTGRYCTLEPCGEFHGDTILQYKFDPIRYAAAKTDKEKLFVSFVTNVTGPGRYVLVDVYSTTTDEQIILTLEPDKRVSVETDQGVGFYQVHIGGTYNDGKHHNLSFQRNSEELWLQIDDKIQKSPYPQHDLDDINHIRVGSPRQKLLDEEGDIYKKFVGRIFNVIYNPQGVPIYPLKAFLDRGNSKKVQILTGALHNCSISDYVPPTYNIQTETTVPVTTTLPRRTMTMPPWDNWGVDVFYMKTLSPPITVPTTTTTTTTPTTTTTVATTTLSPPNFNSSKIYIPAMADDMTIVLIVGLVITAVLLLTIVGILLMCFLKKGDRYPLGKGEDVELKEPLHPVGNHTPSSPAPVNNHNNHMATFDEFSMITTLLNNGVDIPAKDNSYDPANRFSNSSIPWIDDEQNIHPIYNRKKKRPASSISEVLEVMELMRKAKELGIDPDADISMPSTQNPLQQTVDGIMEDSGESKATRSPNLDSSELHSAKALSTLDEYEEYLDKVLDTENNSICSSQSGADSYTSHGRQSTNDQNGDSGYEASSSKPEGDEEITAENTADTISPDSPQQKVSYLPSSTLSSHMTNSKQRLLQNGELNV